MSRLNRDHLTADMFGFAAFAPGLLTILPTFPSGFGVFAEQVFVQGFDTFAKAQMFCRTHTSQQSA